MSCRAVLRGFLLVALYGVGICTSAVLISGCGSENGIESDTQPPSIAITSPSEGDTVSGVVTVSANASDNVGVNTVSFLIDDSLRVMDVAAPWTFSWNTNSEAEGLHTVTAVVADRTGLDAEDAVTVVTRLPQPPEPTVSIVAPANGDTVYDVVRLEAIAEDDLGIVKVEFFADGTALSGGTDFAPPYEAYWDVRGIPNGTAHSVYARATDTDDNASGSQAIIVTVDNTQAPPGMLSVSSSPNGASIFLNGAPTGAITDTTIAVLPGIYTLAVKKPGYADAMASMAAIVRTNETTLVGNLSLVLDPSIRVVLVDHFSNVASAPCSLPESNLESAIQELGLAVSYSSHLNFPGVADVFFLANPGQSVERMSVLNITDLPAFWIDGVFFEMPANYDLLVARITSAAAVVPSYEITVNRAVTGDSLVISGTVKKTVETAGADNLLVTVIETGIRYRAPNGIDHYDDIVRRYLPRVAGEPLAIGVGETAEFHQGLRIEGAWVAKNLEVVASVQSATTGAVYQTGSTR